MMQDILKQLSDSVSLGHLKGATEVARRLLSPYTEISDFGQTGLIAKINKDKQKTILLDAHIDEVGFIVTHIFDSGFLRVAPVGGNDPRILPATPVVVHGKTDIPAVFISNPPHLKGEDEVKSAADTFVDTGLGTQIKDLVSPGDLVSYEKDFTPLKGGRVSGKSLDDRAAVACLIELASRIHDKELPVNVVLCLAEQEELGTRGAVTATFALSPDEAVAIDVSFADAPDVPSAKCGKLGGGAMIGISPILNRKITDLLCDIAKEKKIPHQLEVMGGKTGTDADVITISGSGVPCGLLSIPLRNMHTPAEVVDMADIGAVCDILEAYILKGGAL